MKHALDLRKRPPRSPRVRLGGLVLLPRALDKCRADIRGMSGDYHFNCPLDQRLFAFLGIKADAFRKAVSRGLGDGDMLKWVLKRASPAPSAPQILAWSAYQEQRAPGDRESRQFFDELHREAAPKREDIATWFDLLDVDDYASYGGAP